MFCTLLGLPLISALTVVLLWEFCRKLGYTPQTAILCAFLYGLGTQAWMYAQLDFSEPLLTFCLLAACYQFYGIANLPSGQAVRHLLLAGLFFGFAVMVKIVAIIVLPLLLAYLWYAPSASLRWRFHKVGIFSLVVFLTGLLPVGWYNIMRFGTPFETGYGNEFNFYWNHALSQFWMNLAGLEGSIFLYSPVILLVFWGIRHFWKREKSFAILLFGCIAVFFLFYPFTTNELYYGPRYLTPTLSLFILIAGAGFPGETHALRNKTHRRWWYWLVGFLLVFGMLQQIVGVIVNYHTYYWRIQYTMPTVDVAIRSSTEGQLLLKTPQLPHLLGHFWLLRQAIQNLFTPRGMPLSGLTLLTDTTQRNAWIPYYGLDLWWCHPSLVQLVGWPGIVGIVVILISVIGVSLYRLMKRVLVPTTTFSE
jgi:4-amino-4-deoxy-L-arabinose transferase-like glycosyltransferase